MTGLPDQVAQAVTCLTCNAPTHHPCNPDTGPLHQGTTVHASRWTDAHLWHTLPAWRLMNGLWDDSPFMTELRQHLALTDNRTTRATA